MSKHIPFKIRKKLNTKLRLIKSINKTKEPLFRPQEPVKLSIEELFMFGFNRIDINYQLNENQSTESNLLLFNKDEDDNLKTVTYHLDDFYFFDASFQIDGNTTKYFIRTYTRATDETSKPIEIVLHSENIYIYQDFLIYFTEH